jgi:hypothetical protein
MNEIEGVPDPEMALASQAGSSRGYTGAQVAAFSVDQTNSECSFKSSLQSPRGPVAVCACYLHLQAGFSDTNPFECMC